MCDHEIRRNTQSLPILHLLCPGPQIFAPLRVHLTLSFADAKEIPKDMHNMLVDFNRAVRFKSKAGDSQAELTLHAKQDTQSETKWAKFTSECGDCFTRKVTERSSSTVKFDQRLCDSGAAACLGNPPADTDQQKSPVAEELRRLAFKRMSDKLQYPSEDK